MTERIIKDIRYYESNMDNIEGHYPADLGVIFTPTSETKFIGQRIARSLNASGFTSGVFDHIYLNLTTKQKDGNIQISDRQVDKRIKYIDCGLNPETYNLLNDIEKDSLINNLTFKAITTLHAKDDNKINSISDVKASIDKFGRQIVIDFMTKETKSYRLDVGYQIQPDDKFSKLIINYQDKIENEYLNGSMSLVHYEDIYSIIDTGSVKDDMIIFKPKKSYHAQLACKNYDSPLTFKIRDLNKITATNK